MSETTNMLHDFADYFTKTYRKVILNKLDDDKLPLYLREHISESPNYYTNINLYNMTDTMEWLAFSDPQKREFLDQELADYFAGSDD